MIAVESPHPASTPLSAVALETAKRSTLQSRNVRIHKKRTSVRLEPAMWEAVR
jgi:predicted DNA-binding ribbon-helix-helix protein